MSGRTVTADHVTALDQPALCKPSEKLFQPVKQVQETGRTYRYLACATRKLTYLSALVSQKPAFTDAATGMLRFASPEGQMFDVEGNPLDMSIGHVHQIRVGPLSPGTSYYGLIRLSDDDGNWFFIQERL